MHKPSAADYPVLSQLRELLCPHARLTPVLRPIRLRGPAGPADTGADMSGRAPTHLTHAPSGRQSKRGSRTSVSNYHEIPHTVLHPHLPCLAEHNNHYIWSFHVSFNRPWKHRPGHTSVPPQRFEHLLLLQSVLLRCALGHSHDLRVPHRDHLPVRVRALRQQRGHHQPTGDRESGCSPHSLPQDRCRRWRGGHLSLT